MTDGRTRYADDATLEYIAKLEAERDKLRVLLLRADEALSMAIDIDAPYLSPSERDWIITQARGTHSDITAALQEPE